MNGGDREMWERALGAAEYRIGALIQERHRLREALGDLLAEQFCPATSGGTEGRWCLNHDDQMMVTDTECALVVRCRAVLEASR